VIIPTIRIEGPEVGSEPDVMAVVKHCVQAIANLPQPDAQRDDAVQMLVDHIKEGGRLFDAYEEKIQAVPDVILLRGQRTGTALP
jgi:hypothetical protein